MSFSVLLKVKITSQDAMSKSWEDKYPNKCPLWFNLIGWLFVCSPCLFI